MAIILTAKSRDKTLVYLNDSLSRSELRKLREGNEFYCPDCGNLVLLKIGEIKIPHFAHKSLSACGASEPESALHIEGKILLHHFFKERHISAELEKYLPVIRQRADLFVNSNTAIEFQCSPIAAAEVSKRSAAYASQNFHFAWIAGSREEQENAVQVVKILEYQKEMLIGQENVNHLMLLNPDTRKFYYYSNLFPLSGSRWVGKVVSLPAAQQTFPFAVPKNLNRSDFEKVCTVFAAVRMAFIRSQRFAKNRYRNPFWLLCYKMGIDKDRLPDYIGVPVFGSECIADYAVIWQLKLMQAKSLGRSIDEVLATGSIKLHRRGKDSQARKVLMDYTEFLDETERTDMEPFKQNDLLYAIYCKNVRKLRK
ncbi:competence protein CoiA [Planococcus sp. CAU13]|uniref:competence protein CoiA n=1 Tax=Planococcus sp. CAU13 TaxID=1541197 RepID=UPI00068DCCF7|nr:competence protein CoiA family protein [Planococcus sp. CAU13]